MSTESEQYRSGFESWARANGHPIRFNADGSYAGMNSYRFEGYAGARREASTEPSAIRDAALEEAIAICKKGRAWQCVDGIRALKNYGAAGALTDDASRDKLLTIIASAYQVAAKHDAPAHILDVLANPEQASDEQIDALLPYDPSDVVRDSARQTGERIISALEAMIPAVRGEETAKFLRDLVVEWRGAGGAK